MPRLLLLDNHDSFTWNLAHCFAELGADVDVRPSDEVGVRWCLDAGFDAIAVSPGPGRPEEAGISLELIGAAASARVPLLGVCLGHQALARAHGARIVHAPVPVHGKTSIILHDGRGLFREVSPRFEATRYHSLAVAPDSIPACLAVTARTADGVVMGLVHRGLPHYGVQFHPESVLTLEGKRLLGNFLDLAAAATPPPLARRAARRGERGRLAWRGERW